MVAAVVAALVCGLVASRSSRCRSLFPCPCSLLSICLSDPGCSSKSSSARPITSAVSSSSSQPSPPRDLKFRSCRPPSQRSSQEDFYDGGVTEVIAGTEDDGTRILYGPHGLELDDGGHPLRYRRHHHRYHQQEGGGGWGGDGPDGGYGVGGGGGGEETMDDSSGCGCMDDNDYPEDDEDSSDCFWLEADVDGGVQPSMNISNCCLSMPSAKDILGPRRSNQLPQPPLPPSSSDRSYTNFRQQSNAPVADGPPLDPSFHSPPLPLPPSLYSKTSRRSASPCPRTVCVYPKPKGPCPCCNMMSPSYGGGRCPQPKKDPNPMTAVDPASGGGGGSDGGGGGVVVDPCSQVNARVRQRTKGCQKQVAYVVTIPPMTCKDGLVMRHKFLFDKDNNGTGFATEALSGAGGGGGGGGAADMLLNNFGAVPGGPMSFDNEYMDDNGDGYLPIDDDGGVFEDDEGFDDLPRSRQFINRRVGKRSPRRSY